MLRSTRLFASKRAATVATTMPSTRPSTAAAVALVAVLFAGNALAETTNGSSTRADQCSGAERIAPEAARQWLTQVEMRGEGELRWFGILAYRARLWTPGRSADPVGPLALEIRYARNFTGEQLASRSIDEMRHTKAGSDGQHEQWRAAMSKTFRDVGEGDCLLGVATRSGATRFYFNGTSIGTIDDPQFGRAFFGIWLSPATSQPALRAKLIGEAK